MGTILRPAARVSAARHISCDFSLSTGASDATALCSRTLSSRTLSSRAGVVRLVNLLEALLYDVRVNLCGRDVRMPQHQLHRPEVGAPLEQVRRKTMAQLVRRKLRPEARRPAVPRQDTPD